MTDGAEAFYFWLKVVSALITIIGGLAYRWIAVQAAAWILASKQIEPLFIDDGDFVTRHGVSKEFLEARTSLTFKTVLLYGQRGSGKTTFLCSALKGQRSVLVIKIKGINRDEASEEFIGKLSRKVHFFGIKQDDEFMEDVFKACTVPPIVVVSVGSKCKGEVLEYLLSACKDFSYESFSDTPKSTVRFVVDMTGSRAAIEKTIRLRDLRTVGVHVGPMLAPEAYQYVTERLPKSFTPTRRESVASTIVESFDERVLTLKEVCAAVRKLTLPSEANVTAAIENLRAQEEEEALAGWMMFCSNLSTRLGDLSAEKNLKRVVELLLEGTQESTEIVSMLETSKVCLAPRDLGLFNADCGYHPLAIDPFGTTVSLSGKAIEAALRTCYDLPLTDAGE
jgi:hypothetical protein